MHSSREPAGAAPTPTKDIWHPAELRQVMSRPEIIDYIFALVESSRDYLHTGQHIYSVKVFPSMLAYRCAPEEPVMGPPSRAGLIFHADLYSADRETLRKAIDQFLRHSGGVELGLCHPYAAQQTYLVLIESEHKPSDNS